MQRNLFSRARLGGLILMLVCASPASATITIDFDYSYDTNGFFAANPQAEVLLNDAATAITSRLQDTLSAITPGSGNTWSTDTFNPSDPGNTSANIQVSNLSIAANTVVIYVGGGNFSGTELGLGGYGGFSSSGFGSWGNTVAARGQTGALAATPTDFGPWGGSIAFSETADWYFASDPSTGTVPSDEYDFYSVALHEIGHVLGIGTAPSWMDQINDSGYFTGANATEFNNGVNPLLSSPDEAHWAEGTMSTIMGTNTAQQAAMTPTLAAGDRKYFTTLDFAGLADIGWQVQGIPEPQTWALLFGLGALGLTLWQRRPLRCA
jgi:hypothetical protein